MGFLVCISCSFNTDLLNNYRMEGLMTDKLVKSATQNIVEDSFIDALYNAVSHAEMSDAHRMKVLNRPHPYIRTSSAPPKGSSAYGPLQMTGGSGSMIASILQHGPGSATPHRIHRYKGGFTEAEIDYMNRFLIQGQKFLDYGKEPDKEGYHVKYDYSSKVPGSGQGDLSSLEDRALYDSIGKKILDYEFHDQAKGDTTLFLKNWKMGRNKTMDDFNEWAKGDAAQQYIQRFQSNLAQ
jgi:hypothetical protein